jgi:hypothetical protein
MNSNQLEIWNELGHMFRNGYMIHEIQFLKWRAIHTGVHNDTLESAVKSYMLDADHSLINC